MAMDKLLAQMLANSQITQYGDPRLYKAATMLTPEERPKVPVKLIDPDPKKSPVFRVRPNANGIADPNSNTIFINSKSSALSGDSELLAALLAHEAEHMNRHAAGQDGWEEGPAYAKQLSVLSRLGYDKRNPDHMRAVKAAAKRTSKK